MNKTQYGNNFYERINYLLKMHNIDLVNFLKDVGITRQTYNNWKQKPNPSGIFLLKIAEYLHVEPSWLLCGNERKSNENNNPYLPLNQVKRIYEVLSLKYKNKCENFFYPILDARSLTLLKKWADGLLKPELEQLVEFAEKLEVPISFIINGSGYELEKLKPTENTGCPKLDKYYLLSETNKDIVKEVIESIYIKQETKEK